LTAGEQQIKTKRTHHLSSSKKKRTKRETMGGNNPWFDFIFDNAYSVDAQDAETSIRKKYPHLLHPTERLILAFKDRGGKGRDKVRAFRHLGAQ
jgi:hypothetical protein